MWQLDDDTGRPGPKRGVDMAVIGRTAVGIADREGLDAVSMRRVAAELGFSTMALYRYVESKYELVQVMIDAAYGPPTLSYPADEHWRDRITSWAACYRSVLLAHPWILDVRIVEPPLTPHQIAWMELGVVAFTGTALSEQEKLSSLLTVDLYVRAQRMLAGQLGNSEPGGPDTGMVWGARLAAVIDAERFPGITAALRSGALDDDEADFDEEELSFGLETLLDGIAARMRRSAAGHGGQGRADT